MLIRLNQLFSRGEQYNDLILYFKHKFDYDSNKLSHNYFLSNSQASRKVLLCITLSFRQTKNPLDWLKKLG